MFRKICKRTHSHCIVPLRTFLFHLSRAIDYPGTSLVAQTVKRLLTTRETRVQSLGQEYPLEKEMATHSSTLAWKIPRMEERGGLQSPTVQRVGHD